MRTHPISPRSRLAGALAGAVVVLTTAACAPADDVVADADVSAAATSLQGVARVAADDPPDAPEGLQEALDAVAQAMRSGDADGVAAWLHDPASRFGTRWQSRAGWLSPLPVAHYALRIDPSLRDLASAVVTERLPGARVVYVVEELALDGFDDPARPATYDLFLTVVETPDGWRIAADTDAEPLGLVSTDHLWDLGPVEMTRRGALAALHRPGMEQIPEILADLEAALATTQDRWPRPVDPAVAMIVPVSQDELGELLHVTFDLSNFVAFATSTSASELGQFDLAGSRVVVNPDRFLRHTPTTRRSILVHELVHVATHDIAGPFLPSWLNEGVAQAIGEQRSATGTTLLETHVADAWDRRPPTDAEFVVGGRDRVFLSYQLAWSFVDHLVEEYGADQVAEFYAAAGQGGIGQPGTEPWHLDRASREVFGMGLDELSDRWAASIE